MRNLLETIKVSFQSIVSNKVRAFLTVLGIIIGIGAVIAMLALGQGAQSLILNQVEGLGSNTITVLPVNNFRNFQSQSGLQQLVSNKLDFNVIKLLSNPVKFKDVSAISAENSKSFDVSYKSKTNFATVYGVNKDYFEVRDMQLQNGRAISQQDDDKNRKVAVLGPRIAAKLFGESDPLDKKIRINGSNYTVVGIAKEKSSNFDERIYVPLNTAANVLIGNKNLSQVIIKVSDEELVDSVTIRVEDELVKYFNVKDKDNANFTVFTSQDVLSITSTITSVFTGLLASIASISLVVGGIGIMNIMLVSVTERTKEIGLRKAVGAKQRAILGQFLTEAVMLTFIGGAIGIILGISLAFVIGQISGIPIVLSLESIVLATSVSISIGIIFGFYPAYRAARLNPIDALRYE